MSSIKLGRDTLYRPENGKILLTFNDINKVSEWHDGPLLELSQGELYMVPSPSIRHQIILQKLNNIIYNYVMKNSLGTVLTAPVDIKLSEKDLVIPDIFYLSKNSASKIKDLYIDGAPDLIIEIVSTNRKRDLIEKKEIYRNFGVREYLIVDIDNSLIIQCVLDQKRRYTETIFKLNETLSIETIKGIKIDVVSLFNE